MIAIVNPRQEKDLKAAETELLIERKIPGVAGIIMEYVGVDAAPIQTKKSKYADIHLDIKDSAWSQPLLDDNSSEENSESVGEAHVHAFSSLNLNRPG